MICGRCFRLWWAFFSILANSNGKCDPVCHLIWSPSKRSVAQQCYETEPIITMKAQHRHGYIFACRLKHDIWNYIESLKVASYVHKAHTKTTMTPCKTEREKKRTSTGCWWFCDVMSNNKAGTAQKTGRKKNTNENYEKLKKSNSEWEIFLVNYLNYFLINCVCWKAHKTFDQLSTLIQNTLTHWQTKWSGEFTITKLLQTDSKN